MITKKSKIFVQKMAKKKDALRINTPEDIPEFLKDTISVDGDELVMHNAEGGNQRAPFGMVFGFEKSERTESGYGMWPIADESRIIEKPDGIYARPKVTVACPMGSEIPEWVEGAPVVQNEDGSFTVTTSWGKSTGNMMDCYWMRYGDNENGSPDVNILTKSEPSFDDYCLCTEDGRDICSLREFDERFEQELDRNLSLTPEEFAKKLEDELPGLPRKKQPSSNRGYEFDEDVKTVVESQKAVMESHIMESHEDFDDIGGDLGDDDPGDIGD